MQLIFHQRAAVTHTTEQQSLLLLWFASKSDLQQYTVVNQSYLKKSSRVNADCFVLGGVGRYLYNRQVLVFFVDFSTQCPVKGGAGRLLTQGYYVLLLTAVVRNDRVVMAFMKTGSFVVLGLPGMYVVSSFLAQGSGMFLVLCNKPRATNFGANNYHVVCTTGHRVGGTIHLLSVYNY